MLLYLDERPCFADVKGVEMPQPDDADATADNLHQDEDDYDLLTFGEVAVRLDAEIRALAGQVALLEEAGQDPAQLESARQRLERLREAAARNSRQPINDDNFARFFGYEGKARRNTK
jgi:hypothetical protein